MNHPDPSERLLRAYAKSRKATLPSDAIHPATREMLLAEALRIHRSKPARPTFLRILAFAAPLAALLAATLFIPGLLRQQPKAVTASVDSISETVAAPGAPKLAAAAEEPKAEKDSLAQNQPPLLLGDSRNKESTTLAYTAPPPPSAAPEPADTPTQDTLSRSAGALSTDAKPQTDLFAQTAPRESSPLVADAAKPAASDLDKRIAPADGLLTSDLGRSGLATQNLTGTNAYTGTTQINGGTLAMDGTDASPAATQAPSVANSIAGYAGKRDWGLQPEPATNGEGISTGIGTGGGAGALGLKSRRDSQPGTNTFAFSNSIAATAAPRSNVFFESDKDAPQPRNRKGAEIEKSKKSQPQQTLSGNFALTQTGNRIIIRDEDGSQYHGNIVSGDAASLNFGFVARGSNKIGMKVVVNATLSAAPPSAAAGEPSKPQTRPNVLRGQIRTGNTPPIDLNAQGELRPDKN